jgi:hypothetical protein
MHSCQLAAIGEKAKCLSLRSKPMKCLIHGSFAICNPTDKDASAVAIKTKPTRALGHLPDNLIRH